MYVYTCTPLLAGFLAACLHGFQKSDARLQGLSFRVCMVYDVFVLLHSICSKPEHPNSNACQAPKI